MAGWHWLTLLVVAIVAYFVGAKYPAFASKVGL